MHNPRIYFKTDSKKFRAECNMIENYIINEIKHCTVKIKFIGDIPSELPKDDIIRLRTYLPLNKAVETEVVSFVKSKLKIKDKHIVDDRIHSTSITRDFSPPNE